MKKIKDWFKKKPSKIKLLDEKINGLEKRIFKKREQTPGSFWFDLRFPMYGYEPASLEEEIEELHEKIDVLCKHFKVKLEKSGAREAEWIVKKSI